MFNFNTYPNYNYNNSYYSYYNNPAFFNHHKVYPRFDSTKMYSFNTQNYNANRNKYLLDEPKEEKETKENEENINNEPKKEEEKENVRFKFGDFEISDRSINIFGYKLAFDDLIIILLIIFLFFDSNCDLSLIIILALMLFNINLSSIKNIF